MQVLLAQLQLVGGDADSAARRLDPLVGNWPAYDAAALLLGRMRERLGDLPAAFEAYRGIADRVAIAAERLRELLGATPREPR